MIQKMNLIFWMSWLVLIEGQPGPGVTPGTNCPAGCVSSTSCDPRCASSSTPGERYCISASSSSNNQCCCGCTTSNGPTVGGANQYFWYDFDNMTCSTSCPPRFYPPGLPSGTPGYSCLPCHDWCLTCNGAYQYNCLTCDFEAYQLNSTACYQYQTPQQPGFTLKYNPCPNGYYGIQITQTCVPCDTGCKICAIQLTRQMPNGANFGTTWANYDQTGISCTGRGDPLCGYTLKCYDCNVGYTLINGFCISNNKCLLYAKYNSSAGGAFSSSNCYCFNGFTQVFPGYCARCAINCKTCSGAGSSSCTSCPDGAVGTSCFYNFTFEQLLNWGSSTPALGGEWTTTNAGTPEASVSKGTCTASNYIFGYYGYYNQGVYAFTKAGLSWGDSIFPSNVKLTYTNPSAFSSTFHYGVHFRATLLFIDDWLNGQSILFTQGGLNRYQFTYQMQGVPGQYLCGYNTYDHHDVVDFNFAHTTAGITLNIYSSVNGKAWGIKEVVIHALVCDSTCNSCSGPTSSDCLGSCTDLTQVVVDGICVCDSASGYYLQAGSCVTDCGTQIRDPLTYNCVPFCSFPNYFINQYANGTKECVVNCPGSRYKKVDITNSSHMTCVDDCFDVGQTDISLNQFNFDGFEKTCFRYCPSGTFGDPVSHSCVKSCPTYNGSTVDGYFSSTYFCYESCPSGWAFVPQRACLTSCPSGYYKNFKMKNTVNSSICEQQCSVTLSGQYFYGDNSTGYCTDLCSPGTYGDIASFLCLSVCNNSAFAQSVTALGVTTRLCVINCSLAAGLYGDPQSGFCVPALSCPSNHYGDPLTFQCTRKCSGTNYFGDNSTKECSTGTCANSAFKQNDTKICVATCQLNNSLAAPQWGDSTLGYCVSSCYGSKFGDPQQNMQCKSTCAASPSSTFGLDHLCVVNCSNTTWADPYHPNRICTTSCTQNPSYDSYGYNTTRRCVLICPDGQFAHNVSSVPLCVVGCMASSGLFGNIVNNRCQAQCPSPYYGDVTGNRTCVNKCPWPYYASNCTISGSTIVISADRVCISDCTSCGWADNSSQTCAWNSSGCHNLTYAHQNNHKCVIPTQCDGFADPVSRNCISPCYSNISHYYYGDPSTKKCVLICPLSPDYYGDNTTQTCTATCSLAYIRDPQYLRRCINIGACSRTPLALYGDDTKKLCVVALNCTDGYYGDNNTNICKNICPGPTLLYADNATKQCVSQCGLGWFALNITTNQGLCSQYCPLGQWADNYTVQCTTRCSPLTYGTNYSYTWSSSGFTFTSYGVCQTQCRDGEYARDEDNLCVSNCGNNNQSSLWGDPLSKTCKNSPFDCPQGYYADHTKHQCVVPLDCSNVGGVQYVADNLTKTCVPICPSTVHNYADMNKYLCVSVCPNGYYGYNGTANSSLVCVTQCKNPSNGLYDGTFADPELRICVFICSATPRALFGENVTYTCVEAKYCPDGTWGQVQVYDRQCRPVCPSPNSNSRTNNQKYADNLTHTCVQECPKYGYADLSSGQGKCVYLCPNLTNGTLQFADNSTKKCVTICPANQSTFGDNITGSCVLTCPQGSYAQTTPYRYCVSKCAVGTWGQHIKRTCVTSPLMCPTVNGSLYYAQNISTMCVKKCPAPAGADPGSWGQNTTRACLPSCLLLNGTQSGFKWNLTRVCIDICPAEIGIDGSYSDQGMCYYVCMTGGYYRDAQNNRSCQLSCSSSPIQQYADDTTMRCLAVCPTYPVMYYAQINTTKCVANCSNGYRKLQSNKTCVQYCPNGTFFNPDTYQCLALCPRTTSTGHLLYGDSTNNTQSKCVNDTDCPLGYYADDKLSMCVQNCTQGQWIHGKNCMTQCPDGYYGNPVTLVCVVPTDCPINYYADNQTITCVSTCQGSFANTISQTCVLKCPIIGTTKYYADPVTRLCSTSCTNTSSIQLIKNDANLTCVSQCSINLYFDPLLMNCSYTCTGNQYADNSTRTCVSVCPATPSLFGQNSTYTCVEQCLNTTQFRYIPARMCVYPCPTNYFMQNITRNCVLQCPNMTYAQTASGYCVYNCSNSLTYAYDETNTCQTYCPEPYFMDTTTYKCVFDCPHAPVAYFQVVVSATNRFCNISCPANQFRDFTDFTCVTHCESSPVTYADTTTGSCLAVCSNNYYAYDLDRTCKSTCPGSMFADPNTRTCVDKCDQDLGFFGDSNLVVPACVAVCTSGYYADPYTQTCVSSCRTSPKMYAFDNGDTMNPERQCVYSCPYPWVADNTTNQCKASCSNAARPYLDRSSKSCVLYCPSPIYQYSYMPTGQTVNGQCVKFCPTVSSTPWFALSTNNTCVTKCPNGLYGSTMNNTCMSTCSLANDQYADPAINRCVTTCTHNTSYYSYADEFSRMCVTVCDQNKGLIGDRIIWRCVPRCSNLSQYADLNSGYCKDNCDNGYFADNTTQKCITNCSIYTMMYGDTINKKCVYSCPLGTLYTDNTQRLCVVALNCTAGLYAYNTSGSCIQMCPSVPQLYGDPISKVCSSTCPNISQAYYADPISRQCVLKCPSIPAYFQQNTTQKCVQFCPNNSFADNYTRYCIDVCSTIDQDTFADNTTNSCVKQCPIEPNYYASNYTWQCVLYCPGFIGMYADNYTRSCVYYCPGGEVNTFADDSTYRCVEVCPNATYNQNSTRTCENDCLTGYADPNSKYCIAVCPPRSYAVVTLKVCVTDCPIVNGQQLYAEDGNSSCIADCISFYGTYADPYSKRCVKICPISQDYYAQPNSRTCMNPCPQSPLMYADFSTRTCVTKCPSVPSLYAVSNTNRTCVSVCPNQTWSDVNSRICLTLCITVPQTFGDNSTWSCVSQCPTQPDLYANNISHICQPQCPSIPDYYADNITRKCVFNCPNNTYADPNSRRCVTTCPQGRFGVNSTWRCQLACPWRQFADELLNLCVKKCSVDPIYYGNPDTLICVPQCPALTFSHGNPLTQECVNYQSNGSSGCNATYYADNSSRLCVQVCPMAQDKYGDNSTWACVVKCPAGSENTFADNSTMRCVKQCPVYPEYYAQQYSRRCVTYCLQANITYKGSFADNSTRLCIQTCPSTPDYYSDNSTRRCVYYCPRLPLTFADNSTRRCVTTCPSSPDIYGDMKSLRCVEKCPPAQQTFADNNTRLCVKICPNMTLPPLYAQNISQRCVPDCPNNSYADNHTQRCVARCPRYPDTYGDPSSHKCVSKCPSSPAYFADPISQSCVPLCQSGYFAQNTTRRCLLQCPQDLLNWADNDTRSCVSKCPNNSTWGDNQTKKCVTQCSETPTTYADNITRTCILICNNETNGGYADNYTRICVEKCPDKSYGDITTRYCVRYCPVYWYGYTIDNLCVESCPTPWFADNSTWMCVVQCSRVQNLYGQTINNTCVYYCPDPTYASDQNQQCVSKCPNASATVLGHDTFGLNQTRDCVEECPYPLYGYPVTQVCVDICPDPYYPNYTDHRCYKCPDACANCTNPYNCLTCNLGWYLYSGACVQSCPTFPVITYANPNRICGNAKNCTQGYYALNATKSCVSSCPAGYYVNIASQTCDSCMKGCIQCRQLSSCLACNIQAAIWSNYTCYTYCSPLRKYYTLKGCVSACPQGTYLSLTTCKNCNAVCQTCAVTAENCLICANGYYRSNGICVSQCPDKTHARLVNGSQTCISCSVISCVQQPLSFTTSQFVDNFQYHVQIKFNQPVDITKQIDKVIQIQQVTNKRLLAVTTYTYLSYTIYDYGNGLYTFVINNYNPNSGAQIQVQILDPSAIVTAAGQMPTNTRIQFTVDTNNLYSLDSYEPGISKYVLTVVVCCFILLLFAFPTHHSIWMPSFDFIQFIMALILINVAFPPNLLYTVQSCFPSALTFLPNYFNNTFSKPVYNNKYINNNIYSLLQDASFLRVMGHLYFILTLMVVFFIVVGILSKKNPNKTIKKWAKSFLRQTFWKKHLHGIVYFLFFPVFVFSIFNMRIYTYLGTQFIQIFSILNSYIFMILFLIVVIYFAYRMRTIIKEFPIAYLMIQKAYNFILYQKIVLIENPNHHFAYEKNQFDLTDPREPRVNQLLVFPYTIETKAGPWQISFPLVSYLYKFLTAMFLTIAFSNPVIQLILLILLNIAFMVYIIAKRPFFWVKRRQFNNQMYIHNLIVICLIQLILLIFVFLYSGLSQNNKVLITNFICVFVIEGVTVNLIYLVYRVYNYYHQHLWKKFVRSDFFRVNYIVQHLEWTKAYDDQHKKLMSKVKSRPEFLQAIEVDTGQSLANMVKAPSVASSTKDKMKALQLRPNRSHIVSKQYGELFSTIANQKERSHKSLASSERLSKNQRKKVRDTIFGEKVDETKDKDDYKKVQLVNQKAQQEISNRMQEQEPSQVTEYEYEYVQQEYPEGTPMEEITKGCARGDIVMH